MIGVFIGSFNPPTMAHLKICLKLKKKFQKIILVPVNSNDKHLVSMRERINMLNILAHKFPFLEVCSIMDNYAYFNYRVLNLLQDKYGDISLIIGADLLDKLRFFENYKAILQNFHFVVVPREDIDIKKVIQTYYKDYRDKFKMVNFHSNISSSEIRELIQEKDRKENYLDIDVEKYIINHHLYV